MKPRQGPERHSALGPIDDTSTVPQPAPREVTRREAWIAHDQWWENPDNTANVRDACIADNRNHSTAKRARAHLDRVKHLADYLVRRLDTSSLTSDPTIAQIAAGTCQSPEMVKTGLRVLVEVGVVVNVTQARAPRKGGKGRAPKRVLTYIDDLSHNHPPIFDEEMRGHLNGNGGACPPGLENYSLDKSPPASSHAATSSISERSRQWRDDLQSAVIARIAETRGVGVSTIRSQHGTRAAQIAAQAINQWMHRGAPADDSDLVTYYADKISSYQSNPATWQRLEEKYPEAST